LLAQEQQLVYIPNICLLQKDVLGTLRDHGDNLKIMLCRSQSEFVLPQRQLHPRDGIAPFGSLGLLAKLEQSAGRSDDKSTTIAAE